MGPSDTDLAALIGSRICHDLISPIGAINNGLELLQMSGAPSGPEIGLIGESVGSASARIRFFRIAFGASGMQMIGAAEVTAILRDLYDGTRLTIKWASVDPQPRALVRLAFLGLLCLEEALPYGGQIEIDEAEGNWRLTARGDRLGARGALWEMLDSPRRPVPAGIEPAHVQFALLPLIAAEQERKVKRQLDEQQMTLTF
ncbi:MAG: histidine phosphotransferase family protein [Sulfitobacter sp.]|nr:histidine phosphotransferase family protein [Sulfitobacter sp.]